MTLSDRIWLVTKAALDRRRNQTRVNFDLQLHLFGRETSFLIWALSHAHTVRVRDREALLLRNMLPYRTWMRRIILARATHPEADTTVTTAVEEGAGSGSGKRYATIDDDWFRPLDPAKEVRMPYFMHPRIYESGLVDLAPKLRVAKQRFLIGFAGSSDDGYARAARFGIMVRPEILSAVQAAFGSRCRVGPPPLERGITTDRRSFIVSLTTNPADTIAKHALPLPGYLSFLAVCDFVLTPPGCQMPLAHNIVEAMAVGSIPVLNYPGLFDPPLVDGKTCVAFETAQDLAQLPARLDAIGPDQIATMRAAVAAYYDRYLDGDNFARALLNHPASALRVLVNTEGGSIQRLQARNATSTVHPTNLR